MGKTVRFGKLVWVFLFLALVKESQSRKSIYNTVNQKAGQRYTPTQSQVQLKRNSLILHVISPKQYKKNLETFNLDIIHNLAINPKDQVEYITEVNPERGKFIWISYIIKDEAHYDFQIIDRSNNSVLYTVSNKPEFMAKLHFGKAEKLKFVFKNKAYSSYIRALVGLECHGCQRLKTLADKDSVDKTLHVLKDIDSKQSRMHFMSELYRERQSMLLKKLKENHQKVYVFTIAEVLGVVLINVYQICVIKQLLKSKNIV